MRERDFIVYILHCADGSFYVGLTTDLPGRLTQHCRGAFPQCHTFRRRPIVLVRTEHFPTSDDAIRRERQLKRWSRRKKEALVRGEISLVEQFAKRPRQQANGLRIWRILMGVRGKIYWAVVRGPHARTTTVTESLFLFRPGAGASP